ncbi:DUF3179 domain-containing protein [Salisaeta longa]|uniref:DUF3179 domain-containing protein n=1 Tax=Salisaeta longa TaxID=503170 RepID=UPI00058FE1D8|nr:DUF3179 domain-containing protein [Salisaeta longa]
MPLLRLVLCGSLLVALTAGVSPSVAQDASSCIDASSVAFSTRGWDTNFCKHSVPYDEIQSGGVPRDGIPPIDDPVYVSTAAADAWLAGHEPVIRVTLNGAAYAFPLQVLIWHEVVNTTVGGVPVVVTFCPLCYTALAFKRPVVAGERLTFGTTGNLRHSDLIMWDRQTESWWQQFNGTAIVGALTGRTLPRVPSQIVAWRTFRQAHLEGRVLSRQTGHNRPYGQNPYVGYDTMSQRPFAYNGPTDDRLLPMQRVVGVRRGTAARAYPLKGLRTARVVHDTLGGTPLVVLWSPGTASALDERRIRNSRDVGTAGVFRPVVNGQHLTFTANADGTFTDRQTGSTWRVTGRATSGPLAGTTLDTVPHQFIFWFAWSVFHPNTALHAFASSS